LLSAALTSFAAPAILCFRHRISFLGGIYAVQNERIGDLEKSLGFQLKLLQFEFDVRARNALAPFEITPARVSALMIIRANPGCTQTALGEALSVNRASAMKLVNYLEGRGLVKREPGADSRANALHLTPEGRTGLEQMQGALARTEQEAVSALTQEEARAMLTTVRKLRRAIQALKTAN